LEIVDGLIVQTEQVIVAVAHDALLHTRPLLGDFAARRIIRATGARLRLCGPERRFTRRSKNLTAAR